MTTASSSYSHSEGNMTTASGICAHSEGANTVASGYGSHSEGFYTTSSGYGGHAQGKQNKPMNSCTGYYFTNGDAMVIGNGTSSDNLSNAFRVTYAGQVYGLSAFHSTGADYAEYFEWLDSNKNNEDRVGYFVTMDGNKIKKANNDDYILGIVSGQPCVIGNADEDWQGRWLHDDFNRFIKQEITVDVTKTEMQPDDNGDLVPVEVPTGETTTGWNYVVNPTYNVDQEYISREDRPEWSAVGIVGVLAVRDDGTCEINSYAKCGINGVATKSNDKSDYRVIGRVSDNVVKVILR